MTETNLAEILGCSIHTIQIMDVGAAALTQETYHQLLTLDHANVTGFEPNPAEYAKLQNRQGPYRYLPFFLGNGAPARFHIARYPGCSSLLPPNSTVIDMFQTIGCADAAQRCKKTRRCSRDRKRSGICPFVSKSAAVWRPSVLPARARFCNSQID